MADRMTPMRENPGIRTASWNRPRDGLQPIQEIAGAREWVPPKPKRDDSRDGTGLEPQIPMPEREHGAAFAGAREQSDIQLETFSTVTAEDVADTIAENCNCVFCGATDKADLLIPGVAGVEVRDGRSPVICSACIVRLYETLRTEQPKYRLRLAMERIMAGDVTPEMVEMFEKLSRGK